MKAVQRAGKSGPRLTANRKQQMALLSVLRQLRSDAGLRQIDLAEALGKRQAFVSYYESGERRLDLLELRQVCEVLGISLGGFVRKFEKELLDPRYQQFHRQPVPQTIPRRTANTQMFRSHGSPPASTLSRRAAPARKKEPPKLLSQLKQ